MQWGKVGGTRGEEKGVVEREEVEEIRWGEERDNGIRKKGKG